VQQSSGVADGSQHTSDQASGSSGADDDEPSSAYFAQAGCAMNPVCRPHKIVRLIYFDEAGTASEQQEPITVVASVLINADSQWSKVEDYLDSVVATIVPEDGRASFREFHAKELFSSGSPVTGNWGKDKRWEVLAAFLDTFRRFELPVLWMGVDRALLREKFRKMNIDDPDNAQWPRTLAFAFTLQGTNAWFHDNAPDEKGLCIADATDYEIAQMMRAAYSSWRKVPMIANWTMTKLDHLIDAISFRDSNESIGVQLADVCNFLIKRHEMGKTDSEPFYEMIRPSLVFGGFVFPRTSGPEQG
jgi:hypothetical protein